MNRLLVLLISLTTLLKIEVLGTDEFYYNFAIKGADTIIPDTSDPASNSAFTIENG